MARHGRSRSEQVTPSLQLVSSDSQPVLPASIDTLAALTTPETLRLTLALTRTESYWRLTHSSVSAQATKDSGLVTSRTEAKLTTTTGMFDPLVTVLDVSQHSIRPKSRSRKQSSVTQSAKRLPTDKDYKRMLNRLDKIITGSAFSFRSMQITEGRALDLNLDTEERQFLRVKTLGMPTPLKIVVRRGKGAVKVFVSKTVQEPSDLAYDEVYTRDVILLTDPNSRFKQPWFFLGLLCLDECSLSLSLFFGSKHRKHNSVSRLPSLADLNEYRRSEAKHLELVMRVEEIVSARRAEREMKYSDRDYVRENRETLGRKEDELQTKRSLETQRREEALRRHLANLHEKKLRAETIIRRRELRLEAEARAQAAEQERQRLLASQQLWLTLSFFTSLSDALYSVFITRKDRVEQAGKRVKAALTLQRCYRKVVLTINPRRLVKQHALHHLTLIAAILAPVAVLTAKETIFAAIKDCETAMKARNALAEYYRRSNL